MKKILLAILALLLAGTAALAGTPKLSPDLFDCAKDALLDLAAGDYEGLCQRIPFSDSAPDINWWAALAEAYSDLTDVQTDYAVAFWTGGIWILAVPVQPPSDGSVEALAFSSEDGSSFKACRYATWEQVENAFSDSSRVIWDKEYVGGNATVVADLGGQE